jgi:hypothetical protein
MTDSQAQLRLEDEMRGFFLEWHGGTRFRCVKQNGQVLGEWHEEPAPTPAQAQQILEHMQESGEYLNIIE